MTNNSTIFRMFSSKRQAFSRGNVRISVTPGCNGQRHALMVEGTEFYDDSSYISHGSMIAILDDGPCDGLCGKMVHGHFSSKTA